MDRVGVGTTRVGEKGWPQYELDGLVTLSVTGKQILLPVWHEITAAELIEFSPSLADRVALDTSRHAIEAIADEIADVVRIRARIAHIT